MYARSLIRTPQGSEHPVLTFGPVSVLPAFQNMGIGQTLIKTTLKMAKEAGHGAILIYGDPDYYQRFGFTAAEVFGIRTKGGSFSPALQALELEPGYLKGIGGCFEEAAVYDVDPAAAEEFDSAFQPREKLVTESQKRFLDLLSQSHE
jgi:putative acetyltransferase